MKEKEELKKMWGSNYVKVNFTCLFKLSHKDQKMPQLPPTLSEKTEIA